MTLKKLVAHFAVLIVLFILSAIILGSYFQAATAVVFYVAGAASKTLLDKYL